MSRSLAPVVKESQTDENEHIVLSSLSGLLALVKDVQSDHNPHRTNTISSLNIDNNKTLETERQEQFTLV